MRFGKGLLPIFTALLLISGCAAVKPYGEEAPGLPSITASSIRARGVVEMKKDSFSARGRAVIQAQAPGSFRIEVFGPFGQVAALVASDGERLLINSEGKTSVFLWGDSRIPYTFKANEAVSFLTGGLLEDETGALPGARSKMDGKGRLREYTREIEGRPDLKVTLAEYRSVQGAAVPFMISLEDGRRGLTIKYTEVEINYPFENGFFKVEAPSDQGAKEVD